MGRGVPVVELSEECQARVPTGCAAERKEVGAAQVLAGGSWWVSHRSDPVYLMLELHCPSLRGGRDPAAAFRPRFQERAQGHFVRCQKLSSSP